MTRCMLSCQAVLSYNYVIQSCHIVMSSSPIIQLCHTVMSYSHVIVMTCCHVMLSYHTIMSYSHVIQSCHTVISYSHVIGIVISCHIVIQTCHAVMSCSYVMQSCITWAVSSISVLPCLNSVSLSVIQLCHAQCTRILWKCHTVSPQLIDVMSPTFTYYHSSPTLLWQYPVLGSPSAVCSMETFNDISEKNP